MSRLIRLAALLVCSFIISFSITGCYDNSEIEDLAYVIAIGIDEVDDNNFNLTFQTAIPQAITGGGGEGTAIISFKTDNFLSGLKKASEYLSRRINLSHTKIIVFSESVAKKGITAFINGFQESLEIRQDIKIVVSSEEAKKYLESVQPKLSANPSKYYELLFRSYETDFLVPQTQLEDFQYRAKSVGAQPVAILTAPDKNINESGKSESGGGGEGKKTGGEQEKKSGGGEEGGKEGEEQKQSMSLKGLAVFNNDKMIGTLDEKESSILAVMTGSKNINLTLVDPFDDKYKILSSIKRERASTTAINFQKGKPVITLDLKLDINIESSQSSIDYGIPQNSEKLNNIYRDLLAKEIKKLLEKVTYGLKSDVFGYGELAKKNFLTSKNWESAQWQKVFPQAEYKLKLETEIITRK